MQRIGPYIPMQSLVYYLDPYNTQKCYAGSGTTAYNLIDNSPATLSNIAHSSASFSNSGSGAITSSASYNLSLTGGFTMMQFLNLTSAQGGFVNYVSGSNQIDFYAGGLTQMRWDTYSTGGSLYSSTAIPTGKWACWTGTFSGVSVSGTNGISSIYYNGVLDSTSTTIAGPASNNATFQVGVYSAPCNGLIGPTLFWNTALTASQVRAAFVALKGRYGL